MLTKAEQVLSFGLPNVDQAFSGFRTGDFAVLHGHPFCKTLLFMLSIRCQLPKEQKRFVSTAIYIDGGNTFNPYAISASAQQHNLDPRSALERIFVSRAFTAYQLSTLIFKALENALKHYKSKLILISDITALFLDPDVPAKEALNIFKKAAVYLSELATQRNVIVVASCLPHDCSKRRFALESSLCRLAGSVIKIEETGSKMLLKLETSPVQKPFTVDVLPSGVTLEQFSEA